MGSSDVAKGNLIDSLRRELRTAQELNQLADARCRELSLAITKIEEAIHWLFDSIGSDE